MKVLVINGPNLQLLGSRKPEVYGSVGLAQLEKNMLAAASKLGMELCFFQSNIEGEIVDEIGKAPSNGVGGIIINPAAYTHTSVAIRDAIEAVAIPAVEVHISNVHKREEFRHKSLTAPVCCGVICGFGIFGYELALAAVADIAGSHQKTNN